MVQQTHNVTKSNVNINYRMSLSKFVISFDLRILCHRTFQDNVSCYKSLTVQRI